MLVFDVGGTYIKYAIIEDCKIILKNKIVTPDGAEIVDRLISVYYNLAADYKISEIGVSSAGQVNKETGVITYAGPTIPNYTGAKLKSTIERTTDMPVTVVNDVESCIYNYNDTGNLLYISLGTGIGGAFKYQGTIIDGENGAALEIGHMYHPGGDSFEKICSTKGLLESYRDLTGESITGEQFDELITSGDDSALKIEKLYFDNLVVGIINLKYILDFNLLIIGGGITEAEFFTADKITNRIKSSALYGNFNNLSIELSTFGNDASVLGVYNYIKANNKKTD